MDNRSLIGSIRSSRFPYYDSNTCSIRYKSRPMLIVAVERARGQSDLTALPISSISNESNITEFDLKLQKSEYPLLNLLRDVSYIRTSKITTIHTSDLSFHVLSNLKIEYPEVYTEVLSKIDNFIKEMH